MPVILYAGDGGHLKKSYIPTSWRHLIPTPSNWKKAAIEINHLFLVAGVAQQQIEVEIVNRSLANHKTSTALPYDPKILGALEATRSKVVNFLQA